MADSAAGPWPAASARLPDLRAWPPCRRYPCPPSWPRRTRSLCAALGERAGVTVVADEGTTEAVGGEVLLAAVQNVDTEENHIPGPDRREELRVARGDPAKVVVVVVGVARPADVLYAFEPSVAVTVAFSRWSQYH